MVVSSETFKFGFVSDLWPSSLHEVHKLIFLLASHNLLSVVEGAEGGKFIN